MKNNQSNLEINNKVVNNDFQRVATNFSKYNNMNAPMNNQPNFDPSPNIHSKLDKKTGSS